MTRLSSYFLPTLRDPPADAEAASHKLMVRAGLIRQLGAGLWTYLPAGRRVHRRIEEILRQEMERIGGLEIQMPVLQPAEPWDRTGRSDIVELFKLLDRNEHRMVLAMTHEESVTVHAAQDVDSYRRLPQILYQIQLKERDEPRPRAGVLRSREFTMKDSYSFDRDMEGLERSYELHTGAYARIFDRCGIEWFKVESDVGMMGGLGAHEYMAPCAAGENDIVVCKCGYAANLEVAESTPRTVVGSSPAEEPVEIATPDHRTIEEVSGFLGVEPGMLGKTIVVKARDRGTVLVVLRGDHRLNELKLEKAIGPFRAATEAEILEDLGAPAGFIGPMGVTFQTIVDSALRNADMVVGGNRDGYHVAGVRAGRDFAVDFRDIRNVDPADTCISCGGSPAIEPAIEVGNIFKLGTRYSEALGATYTDEDGRERPIVMGSYGIGPARIAAAAVEQYHDDRGISWPKAVAPFDFHIVDITRSQTPERRYAQALYDDLSERGFAVVLDDRGAGPGSKFADAELLGCPLRLTVGRRTLETGVLEVQIRRGLGSRDVPIDDAASSVVGLLEGVA